jgi:hypothetical protein
MIFVAKSGCSSVFHSILIFPLKIGGRVVHNIMKQRSKYRVMIHRGGRDLIEVVGVLRHNFRAQKYQREQKYQSLLCHRNHTLGFYDI